MELEIKTINYGNRLYLRICGAVCPNCGKEDVIVKNSKKESSFIWSDESTHYYCINCKWEEKYKKGGICDSLLTKEEFLNKNRTKLIDKMLSYEKS